MADVQIDNGQFTRIANVLLEKISQAKLNGTQYAIILFVWRYTYGFQRCEHGISLSFLSNGINTDERMVRREIQKLINDNVITVVKESDNVNPRTIKVNKDYDTWKVVWRGLKSPEGSKKTSPERAKKTPRGEDELDPQERKSLKKEKTKYSDEAKCLSKDLKTILSDKGVTVFPKDWHLKNYAVIDNMLKHVSVEELKAAIKWGFDNDYWSNKIDSFSTIKAFFPKYQLESKGVARKETDRKVVEF